MFHLFALGVTTLFLIGSLLLLIYDRQLGLRYMKKAGSDSMSGVPTIEGAVFALIGLLLAFTISGALQRFDERRQLVVQEANAIQTAYDRLALFEDEASSLKSALKDYTKARIDLYAMPHDFALANSRTLVFRATAQDTRTQEQSLGRDSGDVSGVELSARVPSGADCSRKCIRNLATAGGRCRKASTSNHLHHAVRSRAGRIPTGWLCPGDDRSAQLDPHGDFRRYSGHYPLRGN